MISFKNQVILAPLAGITNTVFRSICKSFGADIVVSEMVSAEGLVFNSQATKELLYFNELERPIGIQLFGCKPESMITAVKMVTDLVHPDFIDLNSGCPVPKVINKNGGAALLRDKKLFKSLLDAMVKSTDIPITVKIRSGWEMHSWVDTEFALIAQDCGVAALTLHPRSKTMGFSGHSFWERIAEVKQKISIPLIGNGDIVTAQDALKMKNDTGCDSIMIGRGALGNPWLFSQVKEILGGKTPSEISLQDRFTIAKDHLEQFAIRYGTRIAGKEMKSQLAWYIKGLPGASTMRNRIFRGDTYDDLLTVCNELIMDSQKLEFCQQQ